MPYAELKVLITGAAGRLGIALTEILTQRGVRVRAFDVRKADYSDSFGSGNFQAVIGDVRRFSDVAKAVRGVDAVYHLAALLPPRSEEDKAETMMANVGGTRNIVEAIAKCSRGTSLIFASSVAVYGSTHTEDEPLTEEHPLSASDFYSESKIMAERLIFSSEIPYVILRLTGIYGIEIIEIPETLPFTENQRVQFIDRRDAVLALANALISDEVENEVLNVAGDESWRLRGKGFIDSLSSALGVELNAKYSQEPTYFDWYDTERSQRILKYQRVNFGKFLDEMSELSSKLGIR